MTDNTSPTTPYDETTDVVLEAFKTQERRVVIEYLANADPNTVPLEELIHVVRTETCAGTRREVKTVLHHHHLPQLEAADIVTYDANAGTVVYHGHPLVDELLETNQSPA